MILVHPSQTAEPSTAHAYSKQTQDTQHCQHEQSGTGWWMRCDAIAASRAALTSRGVDGSGHRGADQYLATSRRSPTVTISICSCTNNFTLGGESGTRPTLLVSTSACWTKCGRCRWHCCACHVINNHSCVASALSSGKSESTHTHTHTQEEKL